MNLQVLISKKHNLNVWLYTICLFTLVISNNLNSIALIIFVVFNLVTFSKKGIIKVITDRLFLISSAIFVLLIFSFIISDDKVYAVKVVERNVAFILLPIAVFSSIYKQPNFDLKLVTRNFIYVISMLLVVSFLIAIFKNFFFNIENHFPLFMFKSWFFTYHYIAMDINISAIYLSLYVSITACLLMLDILDKEKLRICSTKKIKWTWLIFLIFFLFLLSARTILVSTCIMIYFFLFKYANTEKKLFRFILPSLVLFIFLAVFTYYNDVLRLRVISAFKFFDNAKYFAGGISSRIYQWKSILYELFNNNYFYGVGIGDINEKYIVAYQRFNLDWAIENKFNAHNMYLETLFSTGFIGLFLLFFLFLESYKMAIKHNDLKYKLFLLLFMIAGITESLLSRQYGILYFLIFNSLFYFNLKYKKECE